MSPAVGKALRGAGPAFLAAAFALLLALPARAAQLADLSGSVSFMRQGAAWAPVSKGFELKDGDQLRTARGASALIVFDDGSKVEVGPGSTYQLESAKPGLFGMSLALGTMRSWVKKASGRQFKVRTPTAVCSVRGTEFRTTVGRNGESQFDLYSGLLGVADKSGNERVLNPGERIQVDQQGLKDVQKITAALQKQAQENAQLAKKEVGFNMSKEQVMAAAAQEIKLAEYRTGKAMIDVFGNRVRLEQYILRPNPNEFKLVTLNERLSSFNYFFYKGTFNTTLPTDLRLALRQIGGTPFTAPAYYLTGYQVGRSNTTDTVEELASGGHPVDVNHNGVSADAVASYFDAALDKYVSLASGDAFYQTLFDNYSIAYNGQVTYSWSPKTGVTAFNGTGGTGVQSSNDQTTSIYLGNANYAIVSDFPDSPLVRNRIREAYGPTGSVWTQYDNYLVDDAGAVASLKDFNGITPGTTAYKESLLKWNFEQVITSSFFSGRKIDLVIEPKTLIESGLLK